MRFILVVGAFFSGSAASATQIILSREANLRFLQKNVLEIVVQIPATSVLEINENQSPLFLNYRTDQGLIKKSTSGFLPDVRLISTPASAALPSGQIDAINRTAGGIFLSAVDVNLSFDGGLHIPALPTSGSAGPGFLKFFDPSGRRHVNPYAAKLQKRFSHFNQAIDPRTISAADQVKWSKIMTELVTFADRTQASDRKVLFIDSGTGAQDEKLAADYSIAFEATGVPQVFGAWSIAVLGTAPRHGFGNVPCAEFVSEIIRQSYAKAGYDYRSDFKGSDTLLWSNTAAVTNLARALHQSGWIPWDPAVYRPPVGAIAMNAYADTPGHAYMIAGENGRFLVDNGSPKGRDLYTTSEKTIGMMYDVGTFFLPPSIIPNRW